MCNPHWRVHTCAKKHELFQDESKSRVTSGKTEDGTLGFEFRRDAKVQWSGVSPPGAQTVGSLLTVDPLCNCGSLALSQSRRLLLPFSFCCSGGRWLRVFFPEPVACHAHLVWARRRAQCFTRRSHAGFAGVWKLRRSAPSWPTPLGPPRFHPMMTRSLKLVHSFIFFFNMSPLFSNAFFTCGWLMKIKSEGCGQKKNPTIIFTFLLTLIGWLSDWLIDLCYLFYSIIVVSSIFVVQAGHGWSRIFKKFTVLAGGTEI